MFEINATHVSTGLMYPNSGPGPKVLKLGNTTNGYFGVIDKNSAELSRLVIELVPVGSDFTLTSANTDDINWHKFFVDDKVLYVPESALFTVSSRAALSNAGMYSFDSHAPWGDWRDGFPTNTTQDATVVVMSEGVKEVLGVRLGRPKALELTEAEIATYTMLPAFDMRTGDDEYSRTIARLVREVDGVKYASKSPAGLINGNPLGAKTMLAWRTNSKSEGYANDAYSKTPYASNDPVGERGAVPVMPVLELVTELDIKFAIKVSKLYNGAEPGLVENQTAEGGIVETAGVTVVNDMLGASSHITENPSTVSDPVTTVAVGGDKDHFKSRNSIPEGIAGFEMLSTQVPLAADVPHTSACPVPTSINASGTVSNLVVTAETTVAIGTSSWLSINDAGAEVPVLSRKLEDTKIGSNAYLSAIDGLHISTPMVLKLNKAK